jgi:peptidoglycan-associated lipoprotein
MTLAELVASKPLDDAFFLYDSAALSDAARAILQKNADYMKKWTSVRIQLEGHADSRGTNEYNLALAERRASAARDYLVSLGVDGGRITMISKGEEQPFCTEETDACFALNRRAHVVIIAK